MGFLAFIQRKTQRLSQPQRKAPPYESRLSPKSPVRLVHPAGPAVSRSGSTYSHRPQSDRAALFPAHAVEPRSHSSPGLPLPRPSDNTQAVSSRPLSSLTNKVSQTNNPPPLLSQRPHTSRSNRRLSSFTSTGRSHVDLLDAQSKVAAPDFHGRVRASGVRDYGEDVADRNITINGYNLGSPLSQTFSFNRTVADTAARIPHRHVSLSSRASSRASTHRKSDHNLYGRPEGAPDLPHLTRKKKSRHASSIGSIAMESLAELDILPSEMKFRIEEREGTVSHNSLRLESNDSTDSFACPPPAIRRSSGSRASGHRSLTPYETEENQRRAISRNQAPPILFSAAESEPPNKPSMESHAMPHGGQRDVSSAMRCLTETPLNSNGDSEDDVRRKSEDTISSPASSIRHWATAPLTPTTSSSASDTIIRTPSRQAKNSSVDSGTPVFSSVVALEPGPVSFDQLQMVLTKEAKPDKSQAPGSLPYEPAFNMDDYLSDDDSLLGCEDQPESEDLLFTPSYGEFELPGLQAMFMDPTSSNLLRSLEEHAKANPSCDGDLSSKCPSLHGSKRRKAAAHRRGSTGRSPQNVQRATTIEV